MNLLRLLGFHKVEFTSKGENEEVYQHYYYWEWGISFRIPFTKSLGEKTE